MLNGKYSFTEEQFCLIDKMLCEVEMDVKEIEKVEPSFHCIFLKYE